MVVCDVKNTGSVSLMLTCERRCAVREKRRNVMVREQHRFNYECNPLDKLKAMRLRQTIIQL